MIKNPKILKEFEKEFTKNHPVDIEKNLLIFDEMVKFAQEMMRIPSSRPLEGIETDIKYAKAVNGIKGTS